MRLHGACCCSLPFRPPTGPLRLRSQGTGYYNTIKWSPSGRYVALCGFGNLPGAIEFWDKKKGADGR